LQTALPLWRAAGEARTLFDLGQAWLDTGEKQQSFTLLNEALQNCATNPLRLKGNKQGKTKGTRMAKQTKKFRPVRTQIETRSSVVRCLEFKL